MPARADEPPTGLDPIGGRWFVNRGGDKPVYYFRDADRTVDLFSYHMRDSNKDGIDEVRLRHEEGVLVIESQGGKLPSNGAMEDGIYLYRPLDCLVIKMVHKPRAESGLDAYDSVYGIFVEGQDLFPGSGFKAKSHAQIAIRNPECIAGYFRVPGFT